MKKKLQRLCRKYKVNLDEEVDIIEKKSRALIQYILRGYSVK